VDLLAKEMNFDKDNITVIAGAQVNINFVNLDRGVPHNFAVYANSAAETVIFQGQVVIGPGKITYTFNAPADPGIYFFRCDVHPKVMYGEFIVLPSEGVVPSALQVATAENQTSMKMPASVASAGGGGKNATMANTTLANTTERYATAINEFGAGQESITVDLVAENIAFDKSVITVPSGAHVTVNFVNRDSGVPHTFSVYETAAAQKVIFRGQVVTGLAKIKYNFDVPTDPGTYFFRCDIHPTQMTGKFVVVAPDNAPIQANKNP
jgi:plastocyanin